MPSPQKTILITGSSRGIGHAIATALLSAPHHCNVVLVARTAAPLEALASAHPSQVSFLAGDATDPSLPARAVRQAIEAFGRLDGLVLNHGTLGPVGPVREADARAWLEVFTVNFTSCVAFLQAALPHLRQVKEQQQHSETKSEEVGRVVLTSSGAATTGYAGWGAYGASKAALNHLARTLAAEEPDVVAVAVRPGTVDTEMQTAVRGSSDKMDDAVAQRFANLKRDGALLRPEVPGAVMARLVLGAGRELSGRFVK